MRQTSSLPEVINSSRASSNAVESAPPETATTTLPSSTGSLSLRQASNSRRAKFDSFFAEVPTGRTRFARFIGRKISTTLFIQLRIVVGWVKSVNLPHRSDRLILWITNQHNLF